MKIQLNLIRGRVLPARVKTLKRILFTIIVLIFALLGILMGYIYVNGYYQIKSYQSQLSILQGRLAGLNKEVFDIARYKEEWDYLRYRISFTAQLKGRQIWWTPKLEALSELMPENIWITNLTVSKGAQTSGRTPSSEGETSPVQPQPSATLILQGFALPGDSRGLRSIENFARQLKENPSFSKVIRDINLTTAHRVESGELLSMGFRMLCTLIGEES